MKTTGTAQIPIFPKGPIELQAHGTDLAFRDIYVREINGKEYNLTPEEKAEGFVAFLMAGILTTGQATSSRMSLKME